MRPLRRGDRGPVVLEVRAKLARLGLLEDTGTDAFEDSVDRAVREFQQQRGLSVDGVVGPETYRVLDEARWQLGDRVLTHVVRRPYVGDDVAELQQRLLDMGFDCGRRDGIFGPRTEAAVREFQHNRRLVVDGTCGPRTFDELRLLARTVVGGRPDSLREHEMLRGAGPTVHGKFVIVDPGHGGGDPGVEAHGLSEAALGYDLAGRVEGRLAAIGVTAFLSRGPEGDLDEQSRASFANAAEADVVLSLHVDGDPDPACNGVATYFYAGSSTGERLADLVQAEVCSRTGLLDCRTHPKTWDLLRRTRMPAIRLEVGYLTNSADAARLVQPGFRDLVADGVVAAVQRLYDAETAHPAA